MYQDDLSDKGNRPFRIEAEVEVEVDVMSLRYAMA